MKKHPYYDLWMHDDAELSSLLGNTILWRQTIHEWPISCVQKVTLEDSSALIYKCTSGGSIESLFYEQASSPILPDARTLWRDTSYSCMVIEYIDTPPVGQSNMPESGVVKISTKLLDLISRIKGDFPVLLDISTYPKWVDMAYETLEFLRKFIEDGRQYGAGIKDIDFMEQKVISPAIKSIYRGKTGLIHGDLNSGNVFLGDDGYKVIDWQSCKLAPVELDRAYFLSELGVDPLKYTGPEVAYMLYFIVIWWLVKCQTALIPEGDYDEWIADPIARFIAIAD